MAVLKALRQPRYAAMTALMVLIGSACVLLGVWQLSRLDGKHRTNIDLRHNAKAAPVPVADLLRPASAAPGPGRVDVQFRRVTATGTYDSAHQSLLRNQTVNGVTGYLVVTPLHTDDVTLLVVRGFVTGPSGSVTAPVAPTGQVAITGRVWPAASKPDRGAGLPRGQVESINAVDQAKRLDASVLGGYAELLDGQPGGAGLTTIPPPDLSNPAGGAPELQHLAYVIQWFLFAALALAAPVVMMRAESSDSSREIDDEPETPTREQTADEARAAMLADRYGRPRR
jgi:cytochrome oxidase assembly protein ShyY1